MFNWVATMYKGQISLQSPMLYALSFLFLFSIGGLTGIFLGALSVDIHLHDTYGLGLANVYANIEAHQGRIYVEPGHLGGARFIM